MKLIRSNEFRDARFVLLIFSTCLHLRVHCWGGMKSFEEEGEEGLKQWNKNDVALAKQILSKRPGFRESTLPPKGGVKFSEKFESAAETRKLEAYYSTLRNTYSSWKVTKLGNLGTAEWLPQHGVAKVTKQGKFMQSKCHHHAHGFFALYPEEALFLLDVGEIELLLNGVPMSMQSAYSALLCEKPEDKLSTVDEYQVYAHLTKLGYRVQRYVTQTISTSQEDKPHSSENHKKRRKNDEVSNDPIKSKVTKTQELHPIGNKSVHHKLKKMKYSRSGSTSRGWWIAIDKLFQPFTASPALATLETDLCKGKFLDFGQTRTELFSQNWDKMLLPPNTDSQYELLPSIWMQRINRHSDDGNSDRLRPSDFSYPKKLHYEQIRSTSKSWKHYKQMMLEDKKEMLQRHANLCNKMHSGHVKPLLHPNNAHTTMDILKKVKLDPIPCETVETSVTEHSIKFNVFQTDRTKPFKKTHPGKPFLRVVVLTSSSEMLSLYDMKCFDDLSNTVPVKYAIVDSGRIIFISSESISIPVDVNLG